MELIFEKKFYINFFSLEFMMNVGATTGVILDPTYTGKAVRGMVLELQVNPDRFQGKRILFIHTGNIQVKS